jgi:ribosomal protein S18 acetylase RimI-like enzyme
VVEEGGVGLQEHGHPSEGTGQSLVVLPPDGGVTLWFLVMRGFRVLQCGTERFRVGPWRGRGDIGFIAPLAGGRDPDTAAIAACTARLRRRGFDTIVTAALEDTERNRFLEVGYTLREELHLLERDLEDGALATDRSLLRRGRRADHGPILEVDRLAFDEFWRFDRQGLREALTATPVSRLRVADREAVCGYAIFGRAGDRGYLQRLAVHPDRRGQGIGHELVLDGLDWLRRRGVGSVVVNTQHDNLDALRLYERLGFVRRGSGLSVLSYS